MLVLTRKAEESLRIGNDIEIKVLSISKGQVTLGIQAPKSIPVHRREIYDAIHALNRAAADASLDDLNRALPPSLPPH